jgi:hypothetical protein
MIRNFKTIWIWSYVAAVVLFPALKLRGKFIFFAELLLLPAVFLGLQKLSLKELKSPIFKATVFVFGALFI